MNLKLDENNKAIFICNGREHVIINAEINGHYIVVTSEDNTTGIAIRFSDKDNTYALGDKIEVLLTGKLTVYAKALQLSVAIINTAKIGNATITPREATVEELNTNFK